MILLIGLFTVIGTTLTRVLIDEKRIWNNGICIETGAPWEAKSSIYMCGSSTLYESNGVSSGWLSWHESMKLGWFMVGLNIIMIIAICVAWYYSIC